MRVDRVVGKKENDAKSKSVYVDRESDTEEIAEENQRVDELVKANDLLNSFYIRDLERVLEQVGNNNYNLSLESYVAHCSGGEINIEEDKDQILKVLNPKYLPLGKWPNGYGLRAMQQMSVNLALSDMYRNDIFSVNGPPGTGKTTLLRDIIAAKAVERAIKLSELATPDDAFAKSIGELTYNGFATQIRPLKPELRNYGILVASNNNSAVQNISEELPLKESVDEKYRDSYNYFSEVSDRLLGKETWGILAAVLGNYRNRNKFAGSFWPVYEKDKNTFKFNEYLKEKQSNKETAYYSSNWLKAKRRFQAVYIQVQEIYKDMQDCYEVILKEKEINTQICKKQEEKECLKNRINSEQETLGKMRKEVQDKQKIQSYKVSAKEEIKKNTSYFLLKYFFTSSLEEYKQLEKEIQKLTVEMAKQNALIMECEQIIGDLAEEYRKAEKACYELLQQKKEYKDYLEKWSEANNSIIPDEKYISDLINGEDTDRVKAQNVSPWNGKKIIELRETLYLEAMNLHRAFVENSPVLYRQLDAFYKVLTSRVSQAEAVKYATALFQSFQVVVPVISTTFASVGTFLKFVGRDTFGLLLIDEAGQALPQSAVGAIWRAQKTIVVGDPFQIEPVVTIHDKTIQFLKKHFRQSDVIASKETSVQSLADRCNQFGGRRYYNGEKLWIGSPLLVHGRCQRPIFDIANEIAYNGKMIYGTKDADCVECKWEHVVGSSTNKHFVPEQAKVILPQIVEAFLEAEKEGKNSPSLFIITPFRSVKAGLIQYFRNNDCLYEKIYSEEDIEKKSAVNAWIYKNIGTIHTFQGKEADKVIVVLGVDSGEKGNGAIQWASEKPNILNVAVTRAKKQLCIVGDVNKWAECPNFDVAHKICNEFMKNNISINSSF